MHIWHYGCMNLPTGDAVRPSAGAAALPGARRSLIAEYVRVRGGASVLELADGFAVSSDTVRRDLDLLDEQGLVARTHGGAVALATPSADLGSIAERGSRQLAAKRAIGLAAARLVHDGDTVLINGGSTTVAVARAIEPRDVAVVTCSPAVAQESGQAAGRGVFVLGGRWHASFGVVVGPVVLPGASRLRADLLILGVAGIDSDGLTIANIEEAEMLTGMIDAATRVVVVADSTKFDRVAFARLAGLDRVDVLVTDRAPTAELAEGLQRSGVEVIVA